jgi:hypothetical protein
VAVATPHDRFFASIAIWRQVRSST